MTKYLKLPVYFQGGDPDEVAEAEKQAEMLGVKYEPPKQKGYAYVQASKIVSFNEDSEGRTTIEFPSGYRQQVMMKFKDFLDLLNRSGHEIIE